VTRRRITTEIIEVQQLASVLKEQTASQPEVAELLNPKVFRIMMHPFTHYIRQRLPEFDQLLADLAAMEKVSRASGMDASQLLIVLGYTGYGRRILERMKNDAQRDSP